MQDFLIVANGPSLAKSLVVDLIAGKKIIALDGAAEVLYNYKIKPDVILGDFDSLKPQFKDYYGILPFKNEDKSLSSANCEIWIKDAYFGKNNIYIVPAIDQNHTDLEKCIQYCDYRGAKSITILGATGGREDHHENLKICLKKYYKPCRNILAHSEYGTMCYLENETYNFFGKPGDSCGFVSFEFSMVVSEGLKYQCQGHAYSIANQMLDTKASFHISGGALVFMPLQVR